MRYILVDEAGERRTHPGIVSIYAFGEHDGAHYIDWDAPVDGFFYANIWTTVHKFSDLPPARGDQQDRFINCNSSCNMTYSRFKQHPITPVGTFQH